jgi:hypothetical protein
MKFLKDFFSVSNEINENTVIGTIFVIVLLVTTFIPSVSGDKYYVIAGLVAASFGFGALKR